MKEEINDEILEFAIEFTGKKEWEVTRDFQVRSMENSELFLAEIEDEYGVELTDEDMEEIKTLGQLIDKVVEEIEAEEAEAEEVADEDQ